MRSRSSFAALVAVFVSTAAVVLGLAPPARAQMATHFDTKAGVLVPEDTGAGVWDGTYAFVCRDFRIALWIRMRDDKPEMKLRYHSLQAAESFETDWDGRATYYLAGAPATFEIAYKSRNARRIEGSWHWVAQATGSERIDDTVFSVFRSGWGRSAVFKFDKMERQVRRGNGVKIYPTAPPPIWTFRKVSKRVDVLWEEIPF